MKIGIDCRMYSSQFTGIGRYVYELVQNLQQIDRSNHYYLFFNPNLYREAHFSAPNFHKVEVDAPHYSLPEQTSFLRSINRQRLDLMHFTHFNAPIFYFRPSLVTIHDLTLHFFPGKKMAGPLHRLAYSAVIRSTTKKARSIISVSQNTGRDLQQILGISPQKINVIYEGVNPEFQPIKDQNRLQATKSRHQISKPFLLYTGVWRDHKNLQGLIKAFKIVKQQHDIQLVITGRKDNIYAPQIFSLSQDHPRDIIFTDLVPEQELIDLISAATAYVYPSFYEGFGLPPLEAMACHTPVLASKTSCIPESCGRAALYFDPYQPQDIAAKINRLLNDSQLSQKLITIGKNHVQKFRWSDMAQQTLQLYQNVLSTPKQ